MKTTETHLPVEEKKLKKDKAYHEIKELIINGELKENTFISERWLSSVLDISRTPIKAALTELCKEHFLVEYFKKGFMVAEITSKDADEIYEIKELLEPLAFKSALVFNIEMLCKELKNCVEVMGDALEQKDYIKAEKFDLAFHDCYYNYVSNSRLRDILYNLRDQVRRMMMTTQYDAERIRTSYEEHKRILKEIEAGDIDAACQALLQHLRSTRNYHVGMLSIEKRVEIH